jgi:hypothetical protein
MSIIGIANQIFSHPEPVALIDKTLSAEHYWLNFFDVKAKNSDERTINALESYANLRVEQAKEEWKDENKKLTEKLIQIEDFVMMRITAEQSPFKIKNKLVEILNNGK